MKLPPSQRVLYPPYNHAPRHFTARSHKGLQTQEPRTRPTQHYRHQQFQTFPTIFTLLKTRLTVCITFLSGQVMTYWHAELGHRKFYLVKLDCPAWHKRKRPRTSLHDHAACYYYHTSQTQHQPTWPCYYYNTSQTQHQPTQPCYYYHTSQTQHQPTWPYCMLLLQHKPDPAPAYMTMLHVITTQAQTSPNSCRTVRLRAVSS